MDLELASDPSQPTWETPRIMTPWSSYNGRTGITEEYIPDMTPRAELLDRASRQLNALCTSTRSHASLKEFFATWSDPLDPTRVQPNALAWFQASDALATAIWSGREDAARIMLSHGWTPQPPDISAALDILRKTGNKSSLQLLLQAGWEIDWPVNENATPILGCLVEQQDLVEWCLSLNASPNAASPEGETAIHRAVSSASLDTLKLLVGHGGVIAGTDTVAHAALAYCTGVPDRLEIIQYLLDNGAPIDAYHMGQSEQWASPTNSLYLVYGRQNALHFAISFGKKELVEAMISKGADTTLKMMSLKTKYKETTPQELASLLGHEEIAELL